LISIGEDEAESRDDSSLSAIVLTMMMISTPTSTHTDEIFIVPLVGFDRHIEVRSMEQGDNMTTVRVEPSWVDTLGSRKPPLVHKTLLHHIMSNEYHYLSRLRIT
jgi:hypothetical protein